MGGQRLITIETLARVETQEQGFKSVGDILRKLPVLSPPLRMPLTTSTAMTWCTRNGFALGASDGISYSACHPEVLNGWPAKLVGSGGVSSPIIQSLTGEMGSNWILIKWKFSVPIRFHRSKNSNRISSIY